MTSSIQTSTARSSRSRPRRVKQNSGLEGMFAATDTAPLAVSADKEHKLNRSIYTVHESAESENMYVTRVLQRVQRRLLVEMSVADAQSAQAFEWVAPKTTETPVELDPQEFQKMSLVGLMRPQAAKPVQKATNAAVALCTMEPAVYKQSRAQAA